MFEKVVVIGVGLLGGSLALDMRKLALAKRIVGVVNSDASAGYVLQERIVDQVVSAAEAIVDADLIILATPMQAMLEIIVELGADFPENAIITDVGSVKTGLYKQLQKHRPELLPRFVLAHPIAGGEQAGPEAAQVGLFAQKDWIVTPTKELEQECLDTVTQLWQALGAAAVRMSVEEHDAIFAKTSHLPHVVAFSLVNYLSTQPDNQRLFDLAAAGFYDFTRIASSSAQMWRDICLLNQGQVGESIRAYIKELEKVADAIDKSDQEAILTTFSNAKLARDTGLIKKSQSSKT